MEKTAGKEKVKTSVNINKKVWREWNLFVVSKTGSSRKLSEELEKALTEYMERPRRKES